MADSLKDLIKQFDGLQEYIIEQATEEAKRITQHEAFDTGEFYNSIFAGDDGVLSDDEEGKVLTIEYGSGNRAAIAPFRRAALKVPEFVDKYFEED